MSRFLIVTTLLIVSYKATHAQVPASLAACGQAVEQSNRGETLLAQRQHSAAVQAFRSALALCPRREETSLELIRASIGARQFDDATQGAVDFLIHHPSSQAARFLLADSYFMQKRFQEAMRILQQLLAEDDKNADVHKLMGLTLYFYHEDTMAERELAAALRLRPEEEETLYYLGRIYYVQNSFEQAVKAFSQVITSNPKSYKAYDNLGLCYEAMGKTDEAIAAFENAQLLTRQQDAGYDWPYANLGEMLIKQGRSEEALRYVQEALRIQPGSARNNYLMGKALLRENQLQPSLPYLRKAAELDPNYAEPHYLLGELYRKLGRRAEAEADFELFREISTRTSGLKR